MKNYIFCTVQRSGKTWIVETLRRLGLGDGIEVLTAMQRGSAPGMDRLKAGMQENGFAGFGQALRDVMSDARHPCVGISLQWNNLTDVGAQHRAVQIQRLADALAPCLVFFLERRDVVQQAISHYLMNETGYAHSTGDKSAWGRRAGVPYDRAAIDRWVQFTREGYAGWADLLAATNLPVQRLVYEEIAGDPLRHFAELAAAISGRTFSEDEIAAASTALTKVSDETNRVFRERYLAGE